MHLAGVGVEKDPGEAETLFRQAAVLGAGAPLYAGFVELAVD